MHITPFKSKLYVIKCIYRLKQSYKPLTSQMSTQGGRACDYNFLIYLITERKSGDESEDVSEQMKANQSSSQGFVLSLTSCGAVTLCLCSHWPAACAAATCWLICPTLRKCLWRRSTETDKLRLLSAAAQHQQLFVGDRRQSQSWVTQCWRTSQSLLPQLTQRWTLQLFRNDQLEKYIWPLKAAVLIYWWI